ncbi:MAG TPA: universal stress protein [Ramlibacter sp.]
MYANILVAIDGSVVAERGLQEAIVLAAGSGARLTALCVMSRDEAQAQMQMASAALFDEHIAKLRARAQDVLHRAAARARESGVELQTSLREISAGLTADAILAEAAGGYDLLVMGTHGRSGWQRLKSGSDAEEVLRRAPTPVLLVRAGEEAHA